MTLLYTVGFPTGSALLLVAFLFMLNIRCCRIGVQLQSEAPITLRLLTIIVATLFCFLGTAVLGTVVQGSFIVPRDRFCRDAFRIALIFYGSSKFCIYVFFTCRCDVLRAAADKCMARAILGARVLVVVSMFVGLGFIAGSTSKASADGTFCELIISVDWAFYLYACFDVCINLYLIFIFFFPIMVWVMW